MRAFARALLLLTSCGAARASAAATFVNLQLWTCNASNANQQWLVNGTFPRGPFHLISTAPATAGLVWDLNGPSAAAGTIIHLVPKFKDPYPSQQWELLPSGALKTLYAPSMCVTALGAPGAQLQLGPCGVALPFSYAPATRLLSARLDDNTTTLCADAGLAQWAVLPFNGSGASGASGANFTIVQGPRGPPLWWYAAPLGSGPMPHTQYAQGAGTPKPWAVADFGALVDGRGSQLRAGDTAHIPDNDLVGGVTYGGAFCLDVVPAGLLETWAGPLAGGAFVALLFNRSPLPDAIALGWGDLAALGVPRPGPLRVRDVWRGQDVGVFNGSYTDPAVPAHGVAFLILSPA